MDASQPDPLQQGLALLKLAIAKDEALQLEEASQLYARAVELLKYCHASMLFECVDQVPSNDLGLQIFLGTLKC